MHYKGGSWGKSSGIFPVCITYTMAVEGDKK